jgi:60 kDa SS-A/Ro ribonucleoprotein
MSSRLVCIDIQPNRTSQAPERRDILNIGGFSDQVFETIAAFANGTLEKGHWVSVIEQVEI